MKKLVLLSISIIWILIGCSKKEPTTQEVLTSILDNFNNHHSISYDLTYRLKYLTDDDTLSDFAHCELIRDTSDSLFHGTMWLTASDSVDKYYDQYNIYSINQKTQTITEYQDPQNQKWAIKGNIISDFYNIYFLKPEKLLDIIKDTNNHVEFKDTTISQKKFWNIIVRYPDEPPFLDGKKSIWIDQNEMTISRITFQIKFQNNYQYNEWVLSKIEFDETNKSLLEARFQVLINKYSSISYEEDETEEIEPLKFGEIAPDFIARLYPSDDNLSLSDYQGQLVLLDFWYMSCYPCIKAIPHISELQSKYGDKGLVILGLNIDSDEKREKRLSEFLEINKVNYPIVLIGKYISKAYHVSGYPTIFIIDKKGKILFSKSGFSENMNDTLSVIIEKELY